MPAGLDAVAVEVGAVLLFFGRYEVLFHLVLLFSCPFCGRFPGTRGDLGKHTSPGA